MKLERIVIKAKDYRRSFGFYHDILGLRLKTSWQRSDSWGALFHCGDLLLEVIWFPEGEESLACVYEPEHSKTELFLQVNNVDALYNRLISQSDLELSDLKDRTWGFRVFTVYDPDHVKLVFAQPI
jgi:catechol 2,3-dioxygenase-like lactoylglutathione lyase family enzyme